MLAACDVVLSPARMAHPWGRAILEGLASGRPVLATGSYDQFVISGRTGYLYEKYDVRRIAEDILALKADPQRRLAMGAAARAHVASLCSGPARARDLLDVWQTLSATSAAMEWPNDDRRG